MTLLSVPRGFNEAILGSAQSFVIMNIFMWIVDWRPSPRCRKFLWGRKYLHQGNSKVVRRISLNLAFRFQDNPNHVISCYATEPIFRINFIMQIFIDILVQMIYLICNGQSTCDVLI